MVDEISNKTLAILLIGAIAVSLFGTFVSLSKLNQLRGPGITGMATTGQVNVTIQGKQSFTVRSNVNFGILQPNSTGFWVSTDVNNTERLNQSQANDCTDTGAVDPNACYGIEVENDGNVLINLSFSSNMNAAALIGGTAPLFRYRIEDGNKTGAGANPCNGTDGSVGWALIATGVSNDICNSTLPHTGLGYAPSRDIMTIEFNLTIPSDAPVRTNSYATITIDN
jgi:hypothetical protein